MEEEKPKKVFRIGCLPLVIALIILFNTGRIFTIIEHMVGIQ